MHIVICDECTKYDGIIVCGMHRDCLWWCGMIIQSNDNDDDDDDDDAVPKRQRRTLTVCLGYTSTTDIASRLERNLGFTASLPDVDLLVRTGGTRDTMTMTSMFICA